MCIQRLACVALVMVTAGACQKRPPLMPQGGEPPPVRLDFRPPVGRALTEVSTATREVARGEARSEDAVALTTVTRFTPAQGGWLLTQTVSRAELTRAGAPVDTRVDDVLTRFPLKVRLAADGTFVEVVDAGAAQQALHELVPDGEEEALERFFAPEAVVERTRREWETKYGGLLRRNLTLGQRTWAVASAATGQGEVTFVLERTVMGTEATDYGDALRLSLRCLDDVPEGAPEELREAYAAAGSPALTPEVTCEGEQVVARALFVPVRRGLTVKVKQGDEVWTVSTRSRAEKLEEEAR
jgi:hypothetical protein